MPICSSWAWISSVYQAAINLQTIPLSLIERPLYSTISTKDLAGLQMILADLIHETFMVLISSQF